MYNTVSNSTFDNRELPMRPGQAIKHFKHLLNDFEKGEILGFKEIYFIGSTDQKINGSCLEEHNYGYDDEGGDYKVIIGDHIAYRYEILDKLGSGSFGQAVKVFDHKKKEEVALKIIKNSKKFEYQAQVEVKILAHLRDHDPYDKNNII